ncbi:MAG: hypothetical protein COA54_15035 [Thiotrichaceae bacterium]|nr:MAG: hypothetical protein COA54_15035 [Thiotrichaceae bacterium]
MNQIKYISDVLAIVLADHASKVIALSGDWGVGKTFFWNEYIKKNAKNNLFSQKKYSYVSLFGINNLNDLRQAIFENTVPIEKAGERVTFKGFVESLNLPLSELGGGWRSWCSFITRAPVVKDYAAVAFQALHLTVQNTMICFDDLERKGKDLRIRDVLGLASELKERRDCQIVFVFNRDELKDDDDYERFREKVVDYEYHFERTTKEVFEIGFSKKSILYDFYQDRVDRVKLKNIRVINKLSHFDGVLSEICVGLSDDVYKEVAGSLPLLVAVNYASDNKNIPDLDFLRKRTKWSYLGDNEPSEKEKKLDDFLDNYGWSHFDELDELLNDMVIKGYAQSNKIRELLDERQEMYDKGVRKQVVSDLWTRYRSSLVEDENVFVGDMIKAYETNMEVLNPGDINSLTWLLRGLDRDADADKIIDLFLDMRSDWIRDSDIDDITFTINNDFDPRLIGGIREIKSSVSDSRTLEEVIHKFATSDGYNKEDVDYLVDITEDQFFEFFNSVNDDNALRYVKRILEFCQYNDGEDLKMVGIKAKKSLQRMLGQSKLTDIKLKAMGIVSDNPDD